ncbi:hypothetical protein [Massilia sp. Se16.2.3]|uniref:hypothetical protein n=1 Tax=Massilia sp. Se16.2.3 TaxID=2709303 RepID=UPI001E4271C5|nr:hypothetical protein [Massilia sp. Se16.2.3]
MIQSAPRGLLAHGLDRFDRAGDGLGAVGYLHVGPVAALGRAVAVAGDDGFRGDEQARAGDHPAFDGALDADVGIVGAFGAEVAQGGESRLQRVGGVLACQQGAVFDLFLDYPVVPVVSL